jgi:hypothetical protein
MPGESAEYDLFRVLDSQADSKQDTFFIAPKEIGRDGSGVQVLTLSAEGEPDSPSTDQQALFIDSAGEVKLKAPDGTVSGVGETLDPTTVDISQLQNSDTKADLTQSGGVLVNSQIPSLSITSVTTVPDQTARLSLTAQEGDVAVQTDTGEAYVLSTNDPTVDSNWIEVSIDVLKQIVGQQITPSQVGTSSSPVTVQADNVTASATTETQDLVVNGSASGVEGGVVLSDGDSISEETVDRRAVSANSFFTVFSRASGVDVYGGALYGDGITQARITFDSGNSITTGPGTNPALAVDQGGDNNTVVPLFAMRNVKQVEGFNGATQQRTLGARLYIDS